MALRFVDDEDTQTKPAGNNLRFLDEPPATPTGLPALNSPTTPSARPNADTFSVATGASGTVHGVDPLKQTTPPVFGAPGGGFSSDKPAPGFVPGRDIPNMVSETAHGTLPWLGSAAGTAAGVPLAPATLGVAPAAGAVLGYAIGDAGANLLDRAMGLKPTINLKDVPQEMLYDVNEGVNNLAGAEVLARAPQKILAPVVRKFTGPITQGILQGSEVAMQAMIDLGQKFGMDLTPAEILKSQSLSNMEQFLSNAPWSADTIQKFRLDRLQKLLDKRSQLLESNGGETALESIGLQIRTLVDTATDKFNTLGEQNLARTKDRLLQKMGSEATYHDLVQPLADQNRKLIAVKQAKANLLFDAARDMTPPDATVIPTATMDLADKVRREIMLANPTTRNNQLLRVVDSFSTQADPETTAYLRALDPSASGNARQMEQMVEAARAQANSGKNIQQLMADRQRLNALSQGMTNFATGETTNDARIFKDLRKSIDTDINTLVEEIGNPTVKQAWTLANEAWSDYKNFLKKPIVRKIAETARPEAIVGTLFIPNNDTQIQEFRAIYGDDLFKRAKNVFTDSLLRLNPNPMIPDKELSGQFIRDQMAKYGDTLYSIYSRPEVNYMRRMAAVLDGQASATKEIVDNPLFRKILKTPKVSGIVDLIVQPRDVANLSAIKRYVGADGVEEVQHALLNKFLVENQEGLFSPSKFAGQWDKYESRVLKEAFPPHLYDELNKLAQVSDITHTVERLAGNPSGTARNVLMGVGIGYMLRNPGKTAAILLGSRAVTELYLSDFGRQWLTKGFLLPTYAQEAAPVAARLMESIMKLESQRLKRKPNES